MSDWPSNMLVKPIITWPGELASRRSSSPFSAAWSSTLQLLDRELREVRATAKVLQVAIPESDFRIDGYPRANARQLHPGVIVSFTAPKAGPLSFPCDRFHHWRDNVRAIALAMEALRKVDRYGITRNAEQYRGWAALPAGADEAMTPDAARDLLASYGGPSAAIKATHPDRGGSVDDFHRVQEARRVLEQ